MPPASFHHSMYAQPASFRRRAVSLAAAIAANLLLLVMLLTLAPSPSGVPSKPRAPVAFELMPDPAATPTPAAKPAKKAAATRPASARPVVPVTPPPVAGPPPPLDMLIVSKEVFAASDIAKLPSHPREAQGADSADGSAGAGDSGEAGTGPNGERLYNAEWYRKPRQAELAFYLPPGAGRAGWALIACRTVADFRVEDCAELGESPPGSRLAGALRQAAWQFRVRPPRVGGRPLVGAWVRIRFDFIPAEK